MECKAVQNRKKKWKQHKPNNAVQVKVNDARPNSPLLAHTTMKMNAKNFSLNNLTNNFQ